MIFLQVYLYFPGFEKAFPLIKWFLVTFLFVQFLAAYITRSQAKARATKFLDISLPFFCAGLPFLTILGPRLLHPYITAPEHINIWNTWITIYYPPEEIVGLSIMAFGEVITIWGMLGLRGSFSIATEVRVLRTDGPYRWMRHPLYTGEIISIVGFVYYWCNLYGVITTSLFIILQCWRAKREERKISKIYPEYEDYKKKVGFLFPKIFKV